ncbi:uncharacterized protein PHALS_14212 [Plasmopara halstedii]|uniref:Uncharacterized protein n=1 Tax=Plasmopara halstedii TaxID=4781 RepID=A0A0P1ARD3_PLAHL|nr:uncharacterized protein PHALS_14212 [Plasmopara halstedii]CEG43932.1 hypothetical protein PHALS_14212 [Plasmopara halstedii]|eukprot:XP_024580301.1 hypothetical protein PHALS_14212 [Plasmopara halstedii]
MGSNDNKIVAQTFASSIAHESLIDAPTHDDKPNVVRHYMNTPKPRTFDIKAIYCVCGGHWCSLRLAATVRAAARQDGMVTNIEQGLAKPLLVMPWRICTD